MKDFYIWPERLYPTMQWSQARGKKLIGFCWHHKKFITIKQLKQRGCLQKHCEALERFEWQPFWKNKGTRRK